MSDWCVVIANADRARVMLVDRTGARPMLREKAHLQNANEEAAAPRSGASGGGGGAARLVPPLQSTHRFAARIVETVREVTANWDSGKVMLVAPAGMLGLLREHMHSVVAGRLELSAVAKDYVLLSTAELGQRLNLGA